MKLRNLAPLIFLPILASPIRNTAPSKLAAMFRESRNVVDVSGQKKVVYSEKATNSFIYLYSGFEREILLCQKAYELNGKIFVYDVSLPFILISTADSTRYEGSTCYNQKDYVGLAHNHLPSKKNCDFSIPDNKRFMADKLAKIETIVCFSDIGLDSVVINTKIK